MNAELSCPSREQLERLLQGVMPDAEMEELKAHVSGCPRCLEAMRAVTTEDSLVLAVRAGARAGNIATEDADPELLARLRRLHATVLASRATLTSDLDRTEELCGLFAPPQEPDELGRFGPYAILRPLGSGGMGAVFAARQIQPRRIVALKMILAARGGRQRLARFRSETEIIAQLQHPNIVPVHEVGEHEGRPYYTMEYLDGGSLTQKLAAAPLAPRAAADLALVLARTVQFAHERGIVHRDLKPANVLLASGGCEPPGSLLSGGSHPPLAWVPKIADFGLAKQFDNESGEQGTPYRTESGAILGTPGYMAPEQAQGGKEIGPAADIYALGTILYECLTGRPPFRAATVLETLEQVRSQEPAPISRLQPKTPRDLQTICRKCLHKEPGRRYASAADLADDLGRFLRGEPIRARPVSMRERLWKWVRRRPALAALLAVSALSLAALVAGGLVHNARLGAALRRVEASEAEARRQHEFAANGYRAARDTLNKMVYRLERQGTSGIPQLEDLRRDLQEDVLDFYQGLRGADDPDPQVRRDTAIALARAGNYQCLLGQHGPAAENLRRAIALFETLPPEQASGTMEMHFFADCYAKLGDLANATLPEGKREDELERNYRSALAIRTRLAALHPDDPMLQDFMGQGERSLGIACRDVGTVHGDRSRWLEAEIHYKRALAIHAQLVAADPANKKYREDQGNDLVDLAHLCKLLNRPDEAEATFAKAEGVLDVLAKENPAEIKFTYSLEGLYIAWSGFLGESGLRPKEALRLADLAVDLVQKALRLEPNRHVTRVHARLAHEKRATAYEALGRWAEAVKDWERVVELDKQPSQWRPRLQQARVRAGFRATK